MVVVVRLMKLMGKELEGGGWEEKLGESSWFMTSFFCKTIYHVYTTLNCPASSTGYPAASS